MQGLGSILPAERFKPGTAGWEAQTLPLRYAMPSLHVSYSYYL